jgi:transketolase C-terminal domain/subunit
VIPTPYELQEADTLMERAGIARSDVTPAVIAMAVYAVRGFANLQKKVAEAKDSESRLRFPERMGS